MGKKKNATASLGKRLIKDRFGPSRLGNSADSFLHTSELNDGFEWQKSYNARSVTEESSLEAFLNTAQLASRDFTAERLNATIVAQDSSHSILSTVEQSEVRAAQEEHRSLLRIPRRPAWDETTTPEQLDRMERDAFLNWRRELAQLEEKDHILMTPFERNIEFWRQLWRVIERSDIIVQIVDARNPLLFRSEDLETYVKEVDQNKMVMILINKADYLSEKQRCYWAEYFDSIDVRVAFWSATEETDRINQREENEENKDDLDSTISGEDEDSDGELSEEEEEGDTLTNIEELQIQEIDNRLVDEKSGHTRQTLESPSATECPVGACSDPDSPPSCNSTHGTAGTSAEPLTGSSEEGRTLDLSAAQQDNRLTGLTESLIENAELVTEAAEPNQGAGCVRNNSTKLLNGDELVDLLKSIYTGPQTTEGITTVGLVGYPNVGKSSTINALLRCKKVPVSSTPGRTKHFQTLYLDTEVMLCDCPGLVMPSFVATKAEMVLNGILPIDQMREYVPPVATLCQHMSRAVLEATYGIMLPTPQEDQDPQRPPTAHELLSSYGLMRGYMSHKGVPDYHRSARCILKDYVSGKLLYCTSPPNVSSEEFGSCGQPQRSLKLKEEPTFQKLPKGAKPQKKYKNEVDMEFFSQQQSRIGVKGKKAGAGYSGTDSVHSSRTSLTEKPWKRHGNRGKKQKLRRIHAQLDV